MSHHSLSVFCVIGPGHVPMVRELLAPSLAAASCNRPITLHVLNYLEPTVLLDGFTCASVTLQDHSASRSGAQIGFGEAVNTLFHLVQPDPFFLLLNPDTMPMAGFVDTLLAKHDAVSRAGIIEARQWPSEHPKGFDRDSGETPWASGACGLIDSAAFRAVGGFDPVYFLYNEDVDLSWRLWLSGWKVIYEPAALCAHHTGLHSYRADRFYAEHLLSSRNFLAIAYKFFGDSGERLALALLDQTGFPDAFKRHVRNDFQALKPAISLYKGRVRDPRLRITGFNRFH